VVVLRTTLQQHRTSSCIGSIDQWLAASQHQLRWPARRRLQQLRGAAAGCRRRPRFPPPRPPLTSRGDSAGFGGAAGERRHLQRLLLFDRGCFSCGRQCLGSEILQKMAVVAKMQIFPYIPIHFQPHVAEVKYYNSVNN
jgi:hypothetical protein